MEGLAALVIVLVILLPIAWIISEFSSKRWLRLILGLTCIAASILTANSLGKGLRSFEANAWFGTATKKLVDTTVHELEAGHTEQVVASLKQLQEKYHPTYDTRSQYDELVNQAVERMTPTTLPAPR